LRSTEKRAYKASFETGSMKSLTHHLRHYLPLFGVLVAGLVGFTLFSADRNFQLALVIAMAGGYVSWGLIHHHIHRDLYLSVVVEYLVFALLGIVIAFSVIF